MATRPLAAVGAALTLLPRVFAHGYVAEVLVGSQSYIGSNPNWFYQPKGAVVPTAGWFAYNQDNGFVASNSYTNNNITCHKAATPGNLEIPVAAGSQVKLQWNTWPDTHHGPIINYLASCEENCTTTDSNVLEFFKIAEGGLLNDTSPPGTWSTDQLIANNFTWEVTIPNDILPGSYVLRHEIIALHVAQTAGQAQNYPQCINLLVTGAGSIDPCANGANCTKGINLYNEDAPGVLIDIYEPLANYTIPGPGVWSGFTNVTKRGSQRKDTH